MKRTLLTLAAALFLLPASAQQVPEWLKEGILYHIYPSSFKDSDGDGIPDYYETLLGLDPNDASDADAKTLDPQGIYPNIEVYFHFLVREISAAQTVGGSYTALE